MRPYKNIFWRFFLALFFQLASLNIANAEIVDLQKEEKTFGEWKVFCETDLMMSISHCKIATKFFENTAVISIEPTQKFYSQFFIIIPQAKSGSFVTIRVDKSDLILSKNVESKDFGLINLEETKKQTLFQQMRIGEFLFLRFNVKDQEKEITARINLRDFRNALGYLNSRIVKN
jgi:hypothetical protein